MGLYNYLGEEMKEEDKQIQEALENAGKAILVKIMEKRAEIIEHGYKPQSLVIWEGYYRELLMAPELRYSHHPTPDGLTIVGLKII